jgi:hypothetical protein
MLHPLTSTFGPDSKRGPYSSPCRAGLNQSILHMVYQLRLSGFSTSSIHKLKAPGHDLVLETLESS